MIRPFGAVLVALAMSVPALPALAQGYPAPGPYYRGAPAQGGFDYDDDDDQQMYRPQPGAAVQQRNLNAPTQIAPYPQDADAQPLPPPGFAQPYGSRPGYGQPVDQTRLQQQGQPDQGAMRPPGAVGSAPPQAAPQPAPQVGQAAPGQNSVMTLPPEDQPEQGSPKELPPNLKRQLVDYQTNQPAGTIVIDTPNTYLYLVLGHGKALRYGIGVGREGFTWTGTERVSRMKEWPDWFPPAEMIERQPYLPRMMAGGPGNPLGARALYLGHTLYRIHGTNQPSTIGQFVSSGCIRLLNEDIEDLFDRVQVGTRVVVMPGKQPETVSSAAPVPGQGPAPAVAAGPASAQYGGAISARPLPPVR
jgi:lipoprotein-anchoring transpeptidase ErfK/SrfK